MSLYYTQLVDVLQDAGVICRVESVNAGWETRARSSGGFASPPKGCIWHHSASKTSPTNDLNYMIHNSDDAPIGNLLLDRDGVVWPIAAGGANTQGKGGPLSFSRGTVPVDSGNSQLWGIEVANNGVGEAWPSVQIDAYFATSNALNAMFGNQPTDCASHYEWAPTRKIDPATAAAVQGSWQPAATTTSGTWDGNDIRHECQRRAGHIPPPQPPGDTDMASSVLILEDANPPGAMYRCGLDTKTWVKDGNMSAQVWMRINESANGTKVAVDGYIYHYMKNGNLDVIASYGPIVGDIPQGHDEYGRH